MTDSSRLRFFFRGIALATVLTLFGFVPGFLPTAHAQDHLVSPQALQQQAQAATSARQQNIQTLTRFLSTPIAEQAMSKAKVDPVEVRNAIPTLSNADLANLASRATKAQQDFAAGFLTTGMLLVVIIAIVVVIVVIAIH